ncbi:hypothetical protein [Microvirga aerophila]|uniref:Uncharacterized protein n=1 Tax=Microvirga aerophila TaxID=670291 RepID=A0A512C2H5_9HYPH|nr:hypothetical protein [Microvirga aerophila]GEO18410.1 hypothetical protein MAE02_61060 [Microvirga aerophila]
MPKLLIAGLVGAAVFTFANLYTASAPQPADESPVEAQAKIALVQAILDEENEDRQDPEGLQEDEDPEDEEDVHGDLGDEDDQEDPPEEATTPT